MAARRPGVPGMPGGAFSRFDPFEDDDFFRSPFSRGGRPGLGGAGMVKTGEEDFPVATFIAGPGGQIAHITPDAIKELKKEAEAEAAREEQRERQKQAKLAREQAV